MTLDLDALEKAAKASLKIEPHLWYGATGDTLKQMVHEEDAMFVQIARPSAILELISELRVHKRALHDEIREACRMEGVEFSQKVIDEALGDVRAELAALEAK